MQNAVVEKAKSNIDTKMIFSGLILAVLIGLMAFGFRSLNMPAAAKVVTGGK